MQTNLLQTCMSQIGQWEPRSCRSPSDVNVQDLSCFCGWQGYKPQIRFMNRVVSREPAGSISIHYLLYTTTQALPEPGGSQIFSAQQTLYLPRSQLGPPCSVLFSLPVTHAASCSFSFLLLPFPSCSHYSCTRQLPPPTSPHPQISAFNTLFSSRWLFSAPGTKDTSGRKAVTLSSAALSE